MDFREPDLRAVPRGKRDQGLYDAYVALMSAGTGTVEACRRVGVSRRTGHLWRFGRPSRVGQRPGGAASPADPDRDRDRVGQVPSRFLVLAERIVIADGLLMGRSLRAIAVGLGRPSSTVSREVARNRDPVTGEYQPHAAQARAEARRPRPKLRKLALDDELADYVRGCLARRWSPEQIAGTLPQVFPEQPDRHLVHETIYQALYVQGRGVLRREVATALRRGRARRRPRRDPHARTARASTRFTEPMIMISERPAEATDRAVPGHWEGDLIIGAGGRSAIATLVERHTRYLLLVSLPAGRDALSVRDRLIEVMSTLPAHLARSLTWDQGVEMARHHQFRLATGIAVYFCDPASPWLRGSNENTNGLLRQYFPKGTSLAKHTDDHLAFVAAELNSRPRTTLGWDTPAQRLATLLEQTTQQR